MTILDEIVESVRRRVEERSRLLAVDDMKLGHSAPRSLRRAIKQTSRAPVITEIKRASPSVGDIRPDINVAEVARAMTEGGAVGISVLTEPEYFRGRLDFVPIVRDATSLPVLRKDFIVDEYQLYESAQVGADVILLIVEVLGESLPEFVETARRLEMESLVEVTSEDQVELAIQTEPDLIGINNRDLRKMEIDLSRTERLVKRVPDHMVTVSESGIGEASVVEAMLGAGADAVLVGTSIMRSKNIRQKVHELTALRG